MSLHRLGRHRSPASNVGQVFVTPVGSPLIPVETVPGLDALEIDPVHNILPAKEIEAIPRTARRIAVVPTQHREPTGTEQLGALLRSPAPHG